MTTAYGIDLSGFSQAKKTSVVRATRLPSGVIQACVVDSAWRQTRAGHQPLATWCAMVRREMARWVADGASKIVVDVPIDLQELLDSYGQPPVGTPFPWMLTRRPVDRALSALPPLADKIGATVTRWRTAWDPERLVLGETLEETYPAGSLKWLGLPSTGYKGQVAAYDPEDGAWSGHEQLSDLFSSLGVHAPRFTVFSDDDFDGLMCALCGLGPGFRLEGEALADWARELVGNLAGMPDPISIPTGYVLLDIDLDELPRIVFTREYEL